MIDETLLTVHSAAKLLDRSGQSVRGYEKQGRLPAIRTENGVRLFRRGDVLNLRRELHGDGGPGKQPEAP